MYGNVWYDRTLLSRFKTANVIWPATNSGSLISTEATTCMMPIYSASPSSPSQQLFPRWTSVSLFPSVLFIHLFQDRTFGNQWHRCVIGWMPFLSASHKCKSTEGNSNYWPPTGGGSLVGLSLCLSTTGLRRKRHCFPMPALHHQYSLVRLHQLVNIFDISKYHVAHTRETTSVLSAVLTCSRSSTTSHTLSSGSSMPPSDVSRRTVVLINDQFSPWTAWVAS